MPYVPEEEHHDDYEHVHYEEPPAVDNYGKPYATGECLDNENCHRPCHKRFLDLGGDCSV